MCHFHVIKASEIAAYECQKVMINCPEPCKVYPPLSTLRTVCMRSCMCNKCQVLLQATWALYYTLGG